MSDTTENSKAGGCLVRLELNINAVRILMGKS